MADQFNINDILGMGQQPPIPMSNQPQAPAPRPMPQAAANVPQMPQAAANVPQIPQAPAQGPSLKEQMMMKQNELLESQRAGIENAQRDIDKFTKAEGKTDLSALLLAADMFAGTNYSSKYKKPMDKEQRKVLGIKLNNQLMKQKQNAIQQEISIMKSAAGPDPMKALQMMKLKAQVGYYNRYAAGGPMDKLQVKSRDFQAHKDVLSKIDRDPLIRKRTNQLMSLQTGAANIIKMRQAGQKITNQQFHEFQQSVRSNAGASAGGIEERQDTYMNNFGLTLASAKQFLTGEAVDIDSSAGREFIEHMEQVAKYESDNVSTQLIGVMEGLSAGYGSVYDRRPDYRSDLAEKIKTKGASIKGLRVEALDKKKDVLGPMPDFDNMSVEDLEGFMEGEE